jgi:Ca-activated chloride channel family protein
MSCHKASLVGIGTMLLLLLATANIKAIQQSSPVGDSIKLNVLVLDPQDRPVIDVNQEDMRVLEDGSPQTITYFSKDAVTLKYCIVLDTSGSMKDLMNRNIDAAKSILDLHNSTDEVALIEFKDQPELSAAFTPDKEAVATKVESLRGRASHPTAMLDAVYVASQYVAQYKPEDRMSRRALILITDGFDKASYYKLGELRKQINKENIEIFAIRLIHEPDKLRGQGDPQEAKWLLKEITKEAGGFVLSAKDEGELGKVAHEIVAMLRTQYVIAYRKNGQKKKDSNHEVRITIRDVTGREKRTAITRVAYVEK